MNLKKQLGSNVGLIKQIKQRVRALLGHFIYQSIDVPQSA